MRIKLSKKNNIANMLVTKPISIGLASYLAAMVVEGDVASQNVEFLGFSIPLAVFYGLLGAGSSLVTNPITDTVMYRLNAKYQNLSREIVSAGVHVGSNVAAIMLLDNEHAFRKEAVLVALGGHIGGSYIDDIIAPLFGSKKV